MRRPRVFVTRRIPDEGLGLLANSCAVDLWERELPPPHDEICRRAAGCDGLLTLLSDRIDAQVMDSAGATLTTISNYAVGYDNIDVAEAARRGIRVGNTPGVLTETTADLAFALILAGSRRIVESADFVRKGGWKTWGPTLLLGSDVHGAVLGIIGMGAIGRAVARRAVGFGMEILYHDHRGRRELGEESGATLCTRLEDLAERSDVITIHAKLTGETRHLIDADLLSRMKPTAGLVNTARGPIVDQDALARALRDRRIAFAALDVTDPEPLPMASELHELENCIVLPHIGSASVSTRARMAVMAADNLLAGLRGEPLPNAVTPD